MVLLSNGLNDRDCGNFCFANPGLQLLFSSCFFSCISSSFSFTSPSPCSPTQNSFQIVDYATIVNQSMFIGEVMENKKNPTTLVCHKVVEFLFLKINLLLWRCFNNVTWLLTAQLNKHLALLVF